MTKRFFTTFVLISCTVSMLSTSYVAYQAYKAKRRIDTITEKVQLVEDGLEVVKHVVSSPGVRARLDRLIK